MIASGVRSSWEALAANLCCSVDVCLEPGEEAVDRVCEILELVRGSLEREALVEIALGDLPRSCRHRAERLQDPARDQPTERDRDRGHDRQRDPGLDEPLVETVAVTLERRNVPLAHIAGDERVRREMVDGPRVGRPVPGPGCDDQVNPGVAAEE